MTIDRAIPISVRSKSTSRQRSAQSSPRRMPVRAASMSIGASRASSCSLASMTARTSATLGAETGLGDARQSGAVGDVVADPFPARAWCKATQMMTWTFRRVFAYRPQAFRSP